MNNVSDQLLRYRPWRGEVQAPVWGAWAMARLSLFQMARRKLFWGLYALALMIFFFFFYGQYLVVWIQQQTATQSVPIAGFSIEVSKFVVFLDKLNLNGSAHTFGNFIWFQGHILMIVLALAGAVLVGNDFQYGSLPFYLSKPIARRHYLLGKFLGVGLFINLLTTLPALVLFIQAGLLYDWEVYYVERWRELLGILGYGTLLTTTLSLLLVTTAVMVRRTVPLIMVWAGVFVLCRILANMLVEGAHLDVRWRLIDLWNDLYLAGLWCLGAERDSIKPAEQPEFWEAFAALGLVIAVCLVYLRKRVRAVEVIA